MTKVSWPGRVFLLCWPVSHVRGWYRDAVLAGGGGGVGVVAGVQYDVQPGLVAEEAPGLAVGEGGGGGRTGAACAGCGVSGRRL